MLAGAKPDASELVTQIASFNPLLSARCISEGRATVRPEVYKNVVKQLLVITENPKISLNVRIQAGALLGEFEDPRFEKLMLPQGYALLPPMVQIPGKVYKIGSGKNEVSESYLDEIPRHSVTLNTFWIGKFPVTNAEFECFINTGGYDTPGYWTEQGWAWRQGRFDESVRKWLLDGYRNVRSQVLNEVDRLEPSRAEDSKEMDVWYKILMEWSNEQVEVELDKLFKERNCHPHDVPCYWDDPVFNSPTQPVITTWFEAQAYCEWLSKITGKKYRLPRESEWEAATGGSNRKRPWGSDADTSRFNILPSGVLRTTPIGVYPNGASEFRVFDLLGNVWEWTSSAKFPYPYKTDDGRENPFLLDSRRVVRGGSWAVSESSSRNSCRGNFPPDNIVRNYIGFRVVCEEE
jgi:formylglycine-generating enzyme required for sulfatase activity